MTNKKARKCLASARRNARDHGRLHWGGGGGRGTSPRAIFSTFDIRHLNVAREESTWNGPRPLPLRRAIAPPSWPPLPVTRIIHSPNLLKKRWLQLTFYAAESGEEMLWCCRIANGNRRPCRWIILFYNAIKMPHTQTTTAHRQHRKRKGPEVRSRNAQFVLNVNNTSVMEVIPLQLKWRHILQYWYTRAQWQWFLSLLQMKVRRIWISVSSYYYGNGASYFNSRQSSLDCFKSVLTKCTDITLNYTVFFRINGSNTVREEVWAWIHILINSQSILNICNVFDVIYI